MVEVYSQVVTGIASGRKNNTFLAISLIRNKKVGFGVVSGNRNIIGIISPVMKKSLLMISLFNNFRESIFD